MNIKKNNTKKVDLKLFRNVANVYVDKKKIINRVLELRSDDFEELRDIFLAHECWYGYGSKMIISRTSDDDDENEYDVMLSFIRDEKQVYLNIIITGLKRGRGEFFDNYFFTWYDNNSFDMATRNGRKMRLKEYMQLLKLLKMADFKSTEEEVQAMKLKDNSCEMYFLKSYFD